MEKGRGKRKASGRTSMRKRLDTGGSKTTRSSQADSTTAAASEQTKTENADPDTGQPAATDKSQEPQAAASSSPDKLGGASPEPNCAICLGKLENKSFTDSCFHMFCFDCLLEWSKVKAECPLCKQQFKSIVHNVRSYDDYDQYHIPRPESRNYFADLGLEPRFRYRTTLADHGYQVRTELEQFERHIRDHLDEQLLHRPARRRYPTSNHSSYRRLRQTASADFRRRVYSYRLMAVDNVNTRRRCREVSPEFFRANPACTHRLVPWLNRELTALLHSNTHRIGFVLELIMGLINRYNINSDEFYEHVYPFIGIHTRHFMHEFLAFARSPYHMAAYDRHAVYDQASVADVDHSSVEHTAQSNENSDVIIVSSPEPDRQTVATGSPLQSQLLPISGTVRDSTLRAPTPQGSRPAPAAASGWDSPTAGPSWDQMINSFNTQAEAQIQQANQLLAGMLRSFVPPPGPILEQQQQPQVINTDSVDSSSDSDVVILDYEKPWSERSPIRLSSDSEAKPASVVHTSDKQKKWKQHHSRSSSKRRDKSRHSKKRHHSSRSRSESRSQAKHRRSRSRSPIVLRLNPSDYRHKKFSYSNRDDRGDRQGSPSKEERSRSSSTDSESLCHHVSYRSHKKATRSRSSSVEIVEYRKHSIKHKKHKKHKKHSHSKKKRKEKRSRSHIRSRSSPLSHTHSVSDADDEMLPGENDGVNDSNRSKKVDLNPGETLSQTFGEDQYLHQVSPNDRTGQEGGPSCKAVRRGDDSVISVKGSEPLDTVKTTNSTRNILSGETTENSQVKQFKKHPSGHKSSSKKRVTADSTALNSGSVTVPVQSSTSAGECGNMNLDSVSSTFLDSLGVGNRATVLVGLKSCDAESAPPSTDINPDSSCINIESDSDVDIVGFSDNIDSMNDGMELVVSNQETTTQSETSTVGQDSTTASRVHVACTLGSGSEDTDSSVTMSRDASVITKKVAQNLNNSSSRNSISLIPAGNSDSPLTPSRDPLALSRSSDSPMTPSRDPLGLSSVLDSPMVRYRDPLTLSRNWDSPMYPSGDDLSYYDSRLRSERDPFSLGRSDSLLTANDVLQQVTSQYLARNIDPITSSSYTVPQYYTTHGRKQLQGDVSNSPTVHAETEPTAAPQQGISSDRRNQAKSTLSQNEVTSSVNRKVHTVTAEESYLQESLAELGQGHKLQERTSVLSEESKPERGAFAEFSGESPLQTNMPELSREIRLQESAVKLPEESPLQENAVVFSGESMRQTNMCRTKPLDCSNLQTSTAEFPDETSTAKHSDSRFTNVPNAVESSMDDSPCDSHATVREKGSDIDIEVCHAAVSGEYSDSDIGVSHAAVREDCSDSDTEINLSEVSRECSDSDRERSHVTVRGECSESDREISLAAVSGECSDSDRLRSHATVRGKCSESDREISLAAVSGECSDSDRERSYAAVRGECSESDTEISLAAVSGECSDSDTLVEPIHVAVRGACSDSDTEISLAAVSGECSDSDAAVRGACSDSDTERNLAAVGGECSDSDTQNYCDSDFSLH